MAQKQFLYVLLFASVAFGQVASNQSLTGKYYFRHVLLLTDGTANVTGARSASGSITFDGAGNFTVAGQELVGTSPASSLASNGTYNVKPGGFATLSNPLLAAATLNARLGTGALVGCSTEAGNTVFDLFIAIPAPSQPVSVATLNGPYWISSLEFPGGGLSNIRNTNFKLTASGTGSFAESKVTGQAANLGGTLQSQTAPQIGYGLLADGTGTLTFPFPVTDSAGSLIAGQENVYVSQDGSYFIGGSLTAGGHGLIVGVRAAAGGASNSNWSGLYFSAGMRFDTGVAGLSPRLSSIVGSVNALGDGNSVWSRRTRQSDGLLDVTALVTYNLGGDGSGLLKSTTGHATVGATGGVFATSGVDVTSVPSYEIYFGVRIPSQSGTGAFLNPLGVFSAASFAPPGNPVAPGEFVTLFGTGLGTQTAMASVPPFPTTLGGAQVTVNGLFAPIYSVTSGQISAVVPYGINGSTASFMVTSVSGKSNSVDVPLALTAPGVFTVPSKGIGDGAALHLNGTVVNAANPASRGEYVSVYVAGLGAVNPAVPDGGAAPGKEPLARISTPLNVYIGGQPANVVYAGLAPGFAGLYQLNVQIPVTSPAGVQDLAMETPQSFTDLVNIAVQ